MAKWKKSFNFSSDICEIFTTRDSFGILCENEVQFYNSNKQEPLKKKRFKRSMYLLRVYKNISCVLHIMHYLLLCVLCTTDYWLLIV